MHQSAGGTALLNMAVQHRLLVFTKLESFHTAGEEVTKLLKDILDTETGEGSDVVVERYDHKKGNDTGRGFSSTSVVVVIDARQTRTLITPERRDPNVDHWNELAMLTSDVTKPKGSILLVIYGDDGHLDDQSLISPQWLRIWKFNDTTAFTLAQNGRCLSISRNFNRRQSEHIKQYFRVTMHLNLELESLLNRCDIAKASKYIRNLTPRSLLVVGDDENLDAFKQYLQLNPLMACDKQKNIGDKIDVQVYKENDISVALQGKAAEILKNRYLSVYTVNVTSIKYCDGEGVDSQEMATKLDGITRYRLPNIAKPILDVILLLPFANSILSIMAKFGVLNMLAHIGYWPLSYDAVVLYPHCNDCRDILTDPGKRNISILDNIVIKSNEMVVPFAGIERQSSREIEGKEASGKALSQRVHRRGQSKTDLESKTSEGRDEQHDVDEPGNEQTVNRQTSTCMLLSALLAIIMNFIILPICKLVTNVLVYIVVICQSLIMILPIIKYEIQKVCRNFTIADITSQLGLVLMTVISYLFKILQQVCKSVATFIANILKKKHKNEI
ncbi:uncharacterized protein LOC144444546 isoform X1 [Glandiceps talaboti]